MRINISKTEEGACDRCGKYSVELFTVTIFQNQKKSTHKLCKNCAIIAKKFVDRKNQESIPDPFDSNEFEVADQFHTEAAGSKKTSVSKKRIRLAAIVAAIGLICLALFVLISPIVVKSLNQRRQQLESPTTVNQNADNPVTQDKNSDYSINESDYNIKDGPVFIRKLEAGFVSDEFSLELVQYCVKSNTYKTVFDLNKRTGINGIGVEAFTSYANNFYFSTLFTSDLSKLVYCVGVENDGKHVVYIDSNGNTFDVTNHVHEKSVGFSSVVPNDSTPVFTSDNLFVFCDNNEQTICYFDTQKETVVKKYPMSSFYNGVWPDEEDSYHAYGINIDDLPRLAYYSDSYGNYYAYGTLAGKELNGYIPTNQGLVCFAVYEGYIVAFGPGFSTTGGLKEDSNSNLYNYTRGKRITPESQYTVIDVTVRDHILYFIGQRDKEYALFFMEYDSGEFSEPEMLCVLDDSEVDPSCGIAF